MIIQAVPNHDPAGQNVETAIQEALFEAERAGIQGRDVTPFILRTVADKTGGDSLRRQVFCLLLLTAWLQIFCPIFSDILHLMQQYVPRQEQRRGRS